MRDDPNEALEPTYTDEIAKHSDPFLALIGLGTCAWVLWGAIQWLA